MTSTRTIAIADDHALLRKGLMALINLFPSYKVLFDASNGDEFISMLKPSALPDIALLDISMPKKDGYATAEWLRTNYPEVKVLALSTMESETSIIKMIKHGAKGYVLKDAEPAELRLALDEVMSRGFYYNDLVTRKVLQSIHMLADDRSDINMLFRLTDRELEFLKLSCSEKTYQQIAKEMFVSERTVDGYRDALFRKLDITTRVGLVMYAIKNNIVKL